MIQLSNKFKKPWFWPIFVPFSPFWGAKKIFLENQVLSCTTSYGFLASRQNSEKVNDTIQRKCPDRRTDGWKDRPYFIGPFQLPPAVQKQWLATYFCKWLAPHLYITSHLGIKTKQQSIKKTGLVKQVSGERLMKRGIDGRKVTMFVEKL